MDKEKYDNFDLANLTDVDRAYFMNLSLKVISYLYNAANEYAWTSSEKCLREFPRYAEINANLTNVEFLDAYEEECKNLCKKYTKDELINPTPVISFASVLKDCGYRFSLGDFRKMEKNVDFRALIKDSEKEASNDIYDYSTEYASVKELKDILEPFFQGVYEKEANINKKG